MSVTFTRQQLRELTKKCGPGSPLHALLRSTKKPKKAPAEVPPSLGRTLSIVAPMPVSLTNASGKSRHFRTVNRSKKAFWSVLDGRAKAGLIPAAPSPSIGHASISSTMYVGRWNDEDNAVARHKWLIDWLQNRGYLHNDRLLRWSAFPTQIVKRFQDYRIELVIQEPTQ